MNTRLLKVQEAAYILGVSKSWMYEAIARRRIPVVKLAGDLHGKGAVRISPDDLQTFIEAHRIKPR